jgi:hypothetical protein
MRGFDPLDSFNVVESLAMSPLTRNVITLAHALADMAQVTMVRGETLEITMAMRQAQR